MPQVDTVKKHIAPRTGTAFEVRCGESLEIIDPEGGQVSDLVAYTAADRTEYLSNGRTFDYEETINLTVGNRLWSNRSQRMFEIVADDVGRHDFLLTPCDRATFRHFYPDKPEHRGCFGNLAEALAPFGIEEDRIPVAFNCFMNVPVGSDGRLAVLPPISKPGDSLVLLAAMDLIVGLTACSAYASNGGTFKPIEYVVHPVGGDLPQ